jgi:hypothetical protein
MAIGKKKNYDGKLFIINVVSKLIDEKTNKPVPLDMAHFQVKEKVGDKWVSRPTLETQVSGDLVHIELVKGEYEGRSYDIVKLLLADEEEKENYLLDLRSNMLTRNLFNSLCNLVSFKNLSISLYKSKSKKDPSKEYTNISIWQDGNWVKNKFQVEDVPAPEEIKDRKGVVQKVDFTEVDAFYIQHLKDLAVRVKTANNSNKKTSSSKKKEGAVTESVPVTDDPPTDGVPSEEDIPI